MATFEDYGAIGNGTTDDRDAIYDGLNSGLNIIAKEGATYYIGSDIDISGKDVNVSGNATFLFKDASNITISGTKGVDTTLKTNTSVNDTYIEVNSVTGFSVSDLFSITTSEANSWSYDTGYRNGELHEITSIVGDKLYVDDKIWTAWTTGVYTIKVVQFDPITVNMEGIVFKYEDPENISGGLIISYAKDNILDGVIMHDAQNIGIMFHYCYNNIFRNGAVNGSNSSDGGYGLRFQCSSKSLVSLSSFYRNWKSVESSSSPPTAYDYGQFPNRNLTVDSNYCSGCGMASNGNTLFNIGSRFVNTHASSQNLIVSNNVIENVYHSFLTVGIDTEFSNNTISGKAYHVIALIYGKNHLIKDNIIDGIVGGDGGSFVVMTDLDTAGNVEIDNNEVETCQRYFIVNGGTLDANNVTNTDNTVTFINDPCWVFSDKSRNPSITESGNTYNGDNVSETKD